MQPTWMSNGIASCFVALPQPTSLFSTTLLATKDWPTTGAIPCTPGKTSLFPGTTGFGAGSSFYDLEQVTSLSELHFTPLQNGNDFLTDTSGLVMVRSPRCKNALQAGHLVGT